MDLGYSSSDSDTDDEGTKKRRYEEDAIDGGDNEEEKKTKINIDVKNVFQLARAWQPKICKVDDRDERINRAINKVLNDKIDVGSATGEGSELENKSISARGKGKAGIDELRVPKDAMVADFDMTDFYKHNQEELESGRLDAERQAKIGDVVYHRKAGHSNAGRLDQVIQFNLNNEEKIMYQNKERIAKERAIAREKSNAGRG